MSRLGLINKFLPRAPLLTSIVKKPVVFDIPSCSRGAKAAAKGGAKGGGKKGAAMVKPVLEVETDAHKVSLVVMSDMPPSSRNHTFVNDLVIIAGEPSLWSQL